MTFRARSELLTDLPRVQYNLVVNHPNCWTGRLSRYVGDELEVEPVTVSDREFGGFIACKTRRPPWGPLNRLRKERCIEWYRPVKKGSTASHNLCLFEVKSNWSDNIVPQISKQFFNFAESIRVKNDLESYVLYTFDIEKADERLSSLENSIRKLCHGSVMSRRKLLIRPEWTSSRELRREDMPVLAELLRSRYFDPENRERPKQEVIAKRLGISVGALNKTIRILEDIAVKNLITISPDRGEFESAFAEVDQEPDIEAWSRHRKLRTS